VATPVLTRIYGRWHKEVFADLAAILLARQPQPGEWHFFWLIPLPVPLPIVPQAAHPTAYLRILVLAEMLRRMGFGQEGDRDRASGRKSITLIVFTVCRHVC